MRILDSVKGPEDVKALPKEKLAFLAEELRQRIIETTLENGGHLASNLGMVETTLALHRVLDLPDDVLLFDVSHQAYAHKLLTGRTDRFDTLRQAGGLSGFTNREESSYDTVTAGHSGSALSTAVGIAEAKRLKGERGWTVVVIGDGSFTNGMVYEALNQLADTKLRLIVILNDNEMSISRNVGGLSGYLANIRTSEGYFRFKYNAKRILRPIPLVGNGLIAAARAIRDTIKRLTNSETWFESFGLEYIGPAHGNDLEQMTAVLEEAKKKECPVLVHIRTKKGLGYAPAEEHPEKYHSIGGSGKSATEKMATGPAYGGLISQALTQAAERDERICAITAAMTEGCGLTAFAQQYPDRFFDTGIAEEHAVAMAGGLSLAGMLPVTVLYSTFAQRVFDQMWHDVALQNARAVFCLSHGGLVPGDGATHQGLYDIALFSPLVVQQPTARIYAPDDACALQGAFDKALEDRGISILRYGKGSCADYGEMGFSFEKTDAAFPLYKTATLGEGDKALCLVTYGRLAQNAAKAVTEAVQNPRSAGWRITLVVLEQIAPLPMDEGLSSLLAEADRVVLAEEHVPVGGVGQQLATATKRPVTVWAVETPPAHGELADLMKACGLDALSLRERILGEMK